MTRPSDLPEEDAERLREALLDLERVKAQEHELRLVSERMVDCLRTFTSFSAPETIIPRLLEALRPVLEYRDAFLITRGPDNVLTVGFATAAHLIGTRWRADGQLARVTPAKPMASFDIGFVPEWREQPPEVRDGVHAVLHIAIRDGSDPAFLVCCHDTVGFFGQRHLHLAAQFAPVASQALATLERTQELRRINEELSREVAERARAERSLRLIESAVAQVDEGVLIAQAIPLSEVIPNYTNPAFLRVLGLSDQEQPSGALLLSLAAGNGQRLALERAWSLAQQGQAQSVEISNETSDHRQLICEWTVAPIRDVESRITGLAVILRDLTERKRQDAQHQQGQKMESVGQLAAGVAHEINTPIQFIGDNLRFLSGAFGDLGAVLTAHAAVLDAGRCIGLPVDLLTATDAALKRADMTYLTAEIPKAIAQSLDGVTRVAEIVRAMKEFSHPDQGEKKPTDLNKAIQTTLIVARNEYKYVADLVTNLATDLPAVPCIVGEFNQVVLNLVVNAAHAITDVVAKQGGKGTITVSTALDGERVIIRISDTGTGIPESARAKVFDPFFTTKEVGKGTGQGLYIAHTVVVKKHGGSLSFVTESGKGTTFIISLPVTAAA